jgi:type I restriction enzyme S subunit
MKALLLISVKSLILKRRFKMQKEKQLFPQLRFTEFEGEWEKKKLGDICSFFSGGTPTSTRKEYYIGNIPFIGSGNIYDISVDKYISEKALKNSSAKIVKEGDILYALYGANSGDVAISQLSGAINQAILCIRTEEEKKFLFQVLSHKKESIVRTYLQGGQGNLSAQIVKKLKIGFPNKQEQQKIANFLTAIDKRIQTIEKKKILLEHYKKGVMQQLFKQEIRFKDDNGNEFPEWKFKNGNLLFQSISDKNHNSDLPILAVTQDQGAIPRHLINYNIGVTAKSVSSYKVVQVGDFIISLRSFQGGIEYSNYKGICSPAYIILKPIDAMDKTFYKYYLKTPSYIKELTRKLEGIRDGKMISYKYFSEIKLPYPSVKEQTKIANLLSAIDKKIVLVTNKIEQTKTYKKGLLQQMFV